MAGLKDAVESAENETDLLQYIRLVKTAVIGSVEMMDPSATIKDTGYFNHSAFPDLVLTWPSRKAERPLYVRRSFEELEAGHDVERLAAFDPVFLSVGRSTNGDRAGTAQRLGVGDASTNRTVLVTDAATVDIFGETGANADSPLTGAVAAEILPSGRGLLDQAKAESVLSADADVLHELEQVLSSEALASVTVVAGVVAAALGANVPVADLEAAPFSMQEARELLPWLVRAENVTDSDEFWDYVARRLSLKHLEFASEELQSADLTLLCRHGWNHWSALRGSLVAVMRDPDAPESQGWYMRGKLLTCELEDAALRFASYGQAIKERGTLSSATWEAIEPNLANASLQKVILRGLVRTIRIDAQEAEDVTEDTRSILDSVADQYYIDEVALRYGLAAENRTIRLDLGDQLAYNEGDATIRDLSTALAQIGAYRDPIDLSQFD